VQANPAPSRTTEASNRYIMARSRAALVPNNAKAGESSCPAMRDRTFGAHGPDAPYCPTVCRCEMSCFRTLPVRNVDTKAPGLTLAPADAVRALVE
jgi:hypothetical protein